MMNTKYDDKFVFSLYEKMEKNLKHKRFIHSVGVEDSIRGTI